MTNFATKLTQAAARYPERTAVLLDERVLTYRDLDDASARVAAWLPGRGITVGDRVGLMLPNVPEFAELYYGILRAGAIVVPMNPLFKPREVEYYLSDSGAAVVLAWHGVAGEAAEGARRAGTALVVIEPGANWPPRSRSVIRSPRSRTASRRTRRSSCTPRVRPGSRRAPN